MKVKNKQYGDLSNKVEFRLTPLWLSRKVGHIQSGAARAYIQESTSVLGRLP